MTATIDHSQTRNGLCRYRPFKLGAQFWYVWNGIKRGPYKDIELAKDKYLEEFLKEEIIRREGHERRS